MSEDVLAAIEAVKKFGIKVITNKSECTIFGKGIGGYKYKKNLKINAKNSGTLGRLILGLLVNSPEPINLVGDKSLSQRDFTRVSNPLSSFGAKFKLTKNNFLPLRIYGTHNLKPIKYYEKKVQLNAKFSHFCRNENEGTTIIKAKNRGIILSYYVNI